MSGEGTDFFLLVSLEKKRKKFQKELGLAKLESAIHAFNGSKGWGVGHGMTLFRSQFITCEQGADPFTG